MHQGPDDENCASNGDESFYQVVARQGRQGELNGWFLCNCTAVNQNPEEIGAYRIESNQRDY